MPIADYPWPTHLTFRQVAQLALDANFRGEQLVTIVAIAAAESGKTVGGKFVMFAGAKGDIDLSESGEVSVGLTQINFRPSRDKGNAVRDPVANLDPATNLRNAYTISRGGSNFTPWSTFTTKVESRSFRNWIEEARAAATEVSKAGGERPPTEQGDPGQPIRAVRGTFTPAIPIRLAGRALDGDLSSRLVQGTVELTIDEVSEITLEFEDRDDSLLDEYRIDNGTPVDLEDFRDMRFEIVQIETNQGPATPHIVLTCHPSGVVTLRETSPAPSANMSPSDYLARVVGASGLSFRGQATAVRPNVGPNRIDDPDPLRGTRDRLETAWEVGRRLAEEEGFYFFEAGGWVYFASPDFLVQSGQTRHVVWLGRRNFTGSRSDDTAPLIGRPTCRGTGSHESGGKRLFRDVVIDGRVDREPGQRFRPGDNLLLSGVSRFSGGGRIVARVGWSLRDLVSPVEFTARSFERLQPAMTLTPQDEAVRRETFDTLDSAVRRGSRSALDMTTFMLKQVGDAYEFGAETELTDPDPDRFDCSELIQWACAQVGVTFVDGSANQIAAVRKAGLTISLTEAYRTRGAVLYRVGHIAVSLGDGKHSIEARGRKYGVVKASDVTLRGWTEAGRIPGLVYQ